MHGFATLPLAALATSGIVLAQSATGVDPGVAALVGNGVTVVVLAWYVVYDVRVRTPAMIATFATEQAATRQAFALEQAASREAFAREQAATRLSFSAEVGATRTYYEKESSEMRQMLFDNMHSMRQAVHDVRDTANTLITKKALTDALDERAKGK